jgi:5'-nucleotidase
LGRPAIAVSQYIRRALVLDWDRSRELALPVVRAVMQRPLTAKSYWNINLPHLDPGSSTQVIECEPDNQPLDVRYRTQDGHVHYAGSYPQRPRTPGRDVDQCFGGAITVSQLFL